LFIETLIEAEEKVLTAQYTSYISDYGSSKKHKKKDGAVDTINLTLETRMLFKTKINNTKAISSKVQLCKIQPLSDSDDNVSILLYFCTYN